MNYKIQFEKNIKQMEEYISKVKQVYKVFPHKEDFADDFSYILQYEVVIKEYKKYDRDTLNEVILSRMQDDVEELECQLEGFIEELEEYEPDDEEVGCNDTLQKLSIISNVFSKKEEPENLDSYEPYQYEEEELEEDDYYYEDID